MADEDESLVTGALGQDDEPLVEPRDATDGLGFNGRVFATVECEDFYGKLMPGDVVLFGSLDDLGVLGESIERRPVYHSSVYLGTYPDWAGEYRPVVMHNLSYLWWSENAKKRPDFETRDAEPPAAGADYWIPGSEVEMFLGRDDVRSTMIDRVLKKRGGIGPTFIDAYLRSAVTERLWHGFEGVWTKKPPRVQKVRKIRTVVALRHKQLRLPSDEHHRTSEQREQVAKLLSSMIAMGLLWNSDRSGGFPAAELAALVPTLGQRPGFEYMVPGQVQPNLGVSAVHHHPDGGPRAICAMFCALAYKLAGLELDLEDVHLFFDTDRNYHTPRDLWDCPDLFPVAMLTIPPDRGTDFVPRGTGVQPEGPPPGANVDAAGVDDITDLTVDYEYLNRLIADVVATSSRSAGGPEVFDLATLRDMVLAEALGAPPGRDMEAEVEALRDWLVDRLGFVDSGS